MAEQVHTVPLVLQALSLRCILLPELPVILAVARPLGTAVVRVHAIRRLAVEAVFLAEVLLHQGRVDRVGWLADGAHRGRETKFVCLLLVMVGRVEAAADLLLRLLFHRIR